MCFKHRVLRFKANFHMVIAATDDKISVHLKPMSKFHKLSMGPDVHTQKN